MKKSIILTGAIALAISFQSCQSGDNGVQAAKDFAAIDSISNLKVTAFSDSLNMECMKAATEKGMYLADSMMNAAKKGGKKTTPKVTPPPPPPPPPADPKKDKMGGNANTQTKTDKMSGDSKSTTDAKKDKMGGKPK